MRLLRKLQGGQVLSVLAQFPPKYHLILNKATGASSALAAIKAAKVKFFHTCLKDSHPGS